MGYLVMGTPIKYISPGQQQKTTGVQIVSPTQ